jgi:glycosyltransferase involved in cell wall biosynthesis
VSQRGRVFRNFDTIKAHHLFSSVVDHLFIMSSSVNRTNSVRGGVASVPRLVSVIVPAYNASATIERTLRTVMGQTYAHLEIIVVDDGSNDDTAGIVERLGREDPRIILLRQPNLGVATARNLAIAHAYGEFIAPVDSDDIWHPRKIEKQVSVMEDGDDRIGLVYCYSRHIDEHDVIISHDGQQSDARGDVYALLVLGNFIGNASSPLISRGYLQEVGGYDPTLRAQCAQGCEDYAVYLAIAERWEFDLVPEYLVGYRSAEGSMSRNHKSMARSWEIVIADARNRHPELPVQLFRWARGNYFRWLGLGCLGRTQIRWGLYYLVIALVYDAHDNVSSWMVRACIAQLIGPRVKRLKIARLFYKIRDVFWVKYPQSSVWGTNFLDADPAVNDGGRMRSLETDRHATLRSIRTRKSAAGDGRNFCTGET